MTKKKNPDTTPEVLDNENEFDDVSPIEDYEVTPVDDTEEVDENDEVTSVDDTEEADEEPITMTGTVTTRLNIRENDTGSPDTTIVSIVEGGEEITVYPKEGNATFFKVKTKNGVEGYAMRRYIILDAG